MTTLHRMLALASLWAPSLAACADPATPLPPGIDSVTVISALVVPQLDATRTYEYDFSQVVTDSVLLALWEGGVLLTQAWLPLNYLCEDVRGPRLTVELAGPDPSMADYDFTLGTGRLLCSEQLKRYRVLP